MVAPSPRWGRQRRRWPHIVAASLLVGTLAALAAFPAVTIGALTRATVNEKVRICHSTSSESNPYVSNEPAIGNNGDLEGGHHNDPDDIIPPYEVRDKDGIVHQFLGRNWEPPENQAIWQNGCKPLRPEPVKPTITVIKQLVPSKRIQEGSTSRSTATWLGRCLCGRSRRHDQGGRRHPRHARGQRVGRRRDAVGRLHDLDRVHGRSAGRHRGWRNRSPCRFGAGDAVVCTITNEAKEKPKPKAVSPVLECVLFNDGQPDVAYWGYDNPTDDIGDDRGRPAEQVHAGLPRPNRRQPDDLREGQQPRRRADAVQRLGPATSSGRCPGTRATASASSRACTPTVELRKVTVPADDPGMFQLRINNTEVASGGNGTTRRAPHGSARRGQRERDCRAGDEPRGHDSKVECTRNGINGTRSPGPSSTAPIAKGDNVVCTFTNTRKGTPPEPPTPPAPPTPRRPRRHNTDPAPVPPPPPGPAPQLDLVVTKTVEPRPSSSAAA